MAETFLDGRVTLWCGDCLSVLQGIEDCCIDAVVCDPPYHLQSIHKRFAAKGRDETSERYAAGPYGRTAKGFMGKQWDGGDIAFRPEVWIEVLRVLKPGGHVVAFGGTRTYHRMACAIEDAGFEIRDQIGWLYGSGFPKSHDVSKGIDRAQGVSRENKFSGAFERRAGPTGNKRCDVCDKWLVSSNPCRCARPQDDAISDAAREWEGWGTALKPAWEPICIARKPLGGTVAANVIEHGVGAININACRVQVSDPDYARNCSGDRGHSDNRQRDSEFAMGCGRSNDIGRWPANIIHDGSDEVLAAFPGGLQSGTGAVKKSSEVGYQANAYGRESRPAGTPNVEYGDAGSAARFFYTAKADADDRIGSKHPTVKPLDLMQWLVRLVTPKSGTVLDPFAGTGTTGEAAWREGMRAVLIEREAEYQADIRRRMKYALGGPEERARAITEAKGELKSPADLPLFASQ